MLIDKDIEILGLSWYAKESISESGCQQLTNCITIHLFQSFVYLSQELLQVRQVKAGLPGFKSGYLGTYQRIPYPKVITRRQAYWAEPCQKKGKGDVTSQWPAKYWKIQWSWTKWFWMESGKSKTKAPADSVSVEDPLPGS